MGYMRHNVIVATSWNDALIDRAATFARNLGLTVIGPSAPLVNGYRTMTVCPDGSKEGWPESDAADEKREKLRAFLNGERYEDGSTSIEWFEAMFGGDDACVEIADHAWMPSNKQ